MSIEIASFAFGAILILTAIIGGGFQAIQINIPTVGTAGRLACFVIGLLFVLIGIGIRTENANSTYLANPKASSSEIEIVKFRIRNQLGENQVSEQVSVVLDGQLVGTVTVSALHPQEELIVTVPKEDRYSYQLSADSMFLGEDEKTIQYVGAGSGYINVRAGAVYDVVGDISGDTFIIGMEEE